MLEGFSIPTGYLRQVEALKKQVQDLQGTIGRLQEDNRILLGQMKVLMDDFNERNPPHRGRPRKSDNGLG